MSERTRGSAPVEFTLVSMLVVALALAVLQLGVALHVRDTVEAAAADGAAYGARSGGGPAAAVSRTRSIVGEALAPSFARDVTAEAETDDGVRVVVVDVRAPLPVLGPWGPARELHVRARAFDEDQ